MRAQFHNARSYIDPVSGQPAAAEPELCAPLPQSGEALEKMLKPVVARAMRGLALGRLRGYVDQIMPDGLITGWAQDVQNPDLPVLLEVLHGSDLLHIVLACDYREDLASAGIGQGRCSFSFTLPQGISREARSHITLMRAADGAVLPRTDACFAAAGIMPMFPDSVPAARVKRSAA